MTAYYDDGALLNDRGSCSRPHLSTAAYSSHPAIIQPASTDDRTYNPSCAEVDHPKPERHDERQPDHHRSRLRCFLWRLEVNFRKFRPGLLDEANSLIKVISKINHSFTFLQVARVLAGQAGFEPATPGFGVRCSVQLELLTLAWIHVKTTILSWTCLYCVGRGPASQEKKQT
jgi:hypothetical protein